MKALEENGYPPALYTSTHAQAERERTGMTGDLKQPLTLSYITGLSEAVRRILPTLDIQVILHPLSTLRHMLMHPKDSVPAEQHNARGVLCAM